MSHKSLLKRLKIHKDNLTYLQERAAFHGAGQIPLSLHNQIEEEKREIAFLEEQVTVLDKLETTVKPLLHAQSPLVLRLQLSKYNESQMLIRGLDVPGGGQPKGIADYPFSSGDLPAILKALDLGEIVPGRFKAVYLQTLDALGLRQRDRLVSNFHERVGQQLYEALFCEEILTELKLAQRYNRPIACQLWFDPEDILLAQYPWELVYEDSLPLLLGRNNLTLTRYITFDKPPTPLKTKLPLRILFISPRPVDDNTLPVRAEQDAILQGLESLRATNQLEWHVLNPPTWSALEECLDREVFDLIHFDGHGSFARLCPVCATAHYPSVLTCTDCREDMTDVSPIGHLHFEDDTRHLDRVSVKDLQPLLTNSQTQLVVLTACQSSVVKGASVFNGVAPGLIQVGVPAVVAMQGSPLVKTMLKFVKRFYQSLADNKSIAEGVNRGRLVITRGKPVAWFMPVVYLRSADNQTGKLFDL